VKFTPATIPGVVLIELEPHTDERGSFARVFCADEFAAGGLPSVFVQGSISRNLQRGALRGMHLQLGPEPEAKVVRCTRGRLYDVVLDLRPDSPAYLEWLAFELDAESGRAVFIPGGCAHGFLTLEPDTEVTYLMTVPYDPRHQHGVRWNDPAFSIAWPFEPRVIGERDATFPNYSGPLEDAGLADPKGTL
jgi:dTDP-4-dehydrorhamnose 3,5-epimerase